MGLWDAVERHKQEKDEPKPEVVFRDQAKSKGQKKFEKIAHKRNKWGSDANAHFEEVKRQMAKRKK